jgi:hypothetical protein
LALAICKGLRPQFQIKVPQMLENLIKRCWDADPLKRPNSRELSQVLLDWQLEVTKNDNTEFIKQLKATEEFNLTLPDSIRYPCYQIHSNNKYTSQPINTQHITKLLQNIQKQKEIKQVEENIKSIKSSLNSEEVELLDKFIEIKKESIKDKEDKQIKKQVRELKKQLEGKVLSEEKTNEIICCCEKLVALEQQLEQEQLQAQVEIPTNK